MASFLLALNGVNGVAVTTILVWHVSVIGHHGPRYYDFMFPHRSYHARLRARGLWGPCPPGRGSVGAFAPPQGSRGGLGDGTPPNFEGDKKLIDPPSPYQFLFSMA